MPEINYKKIVLTVLVILLIIGGGYLLREVLGDFQLFPEEKIEEAPVLLEPPAPRIITTTVERGDITEEISGLARVAATEEVQLYFISSGRVDSIFVDYDDEVEEGQALARLDVGNLEYQYEIAKIDYQRDTMLFERDKKLVGNQISEFEWQLRELDFQKIQMRFDRLTQELEEATIHAPFAGKVTGISMQEGNNVQQYARVMTIADPTELELQMNVSAGNLRQLVSGLDALVQLDQGYWVEAVVTKVPAAGAEIAPGEPDRRVRLQLVNSYEEIAREYGIAEDEVLQFGSLLRVAVILEERKDTLLLPPAAIREYGDRTFVRVVEGDIRREIDVETGLRTRTRVEILEGLEEGQQVISR